MAVQHVTADANQPPLLPQPAALLEQLQPDVAGQGRGQPAERDSGMAARHCSWIYACALRCRPSVWGHMLCVTTAIQRPQGHSGVQAMLTGLR